MTAFQETIEIRTRGRGTLEITDRLRDLVARSRTVTGFCQVFVLHTSASLLVTENADPVVREDLERALARLSPDGDPAYRHVAEGPDDMPAHLRTVLLGVSATLPVRNGKLLLGTWQGVFLYEHRTQPHVRRVVVTVVG